jgi:putative endonuclease
LTKSTLATDLPITKVTEQRNTCPVYGGSDLPQSTVFTLRRSGISSRARDLAIQLLVIVRERNDRRISFRANCPKDQVMDRQEVGKLGEKAAQKFLKKRGYRIRETGFRCRHGEIDIVAQKKDYLVFVEVRTKSNLDFGTPEESITQAKKERLIASALTYTGNHQNIPSLWRIDVVAIELDDKGKTKRIEHIENAIEQVSRFNC